MTPQCFPPARDTNPITFLVRGGDVKKEPSISLMRRARGYGCAGLLCCRI